MQQCSWDVNSPQQMALSCEIQLLRSRMCSFMLVLWLYRIGCWLVSTSCVPAKVPLDLKDRNAALVRLSWSRSLRWLHDQFCMKDRNCHDAYTCAWRRSYLSVCGAVYWGYQRLTWVHGWDRHLMQRTMHDTHQRGFEGLKSWIVSFKDAWICE